MSDSAETARETVVRTLPGAIARTATSYEAFAASPPSPDGKDYIKDYAAFHASCKTALQHLEALLKLAGTLEMTDGAGTAPAAADGAPEGAADRVALAELVREARTAVARLRPGS